MGFNTNVIFTFKTLIQPVKRSLNLTSVPSGGVDTDTTFFLLQLSSVANFLNIHPAADAIQFLNVSLLTSTWSNNNNFLLKPLVFAAATSLWMSVIIESSLTNF